jgi:hypothetical protein
VTETVSSGNMGKQKRVGIHSPPLKINLYRIHREMKKTEIQIQTPTK